MLDVERTSPGTTADREAAGRETLAQPASRMAVAIVSFNARDYLHACLASVLAEGPDAVVVVDNGSSDGSVELVQSSYPAATVLVNRLNRGYGGAANQAIAACAAPYVLLLNCDTALRPGALRALTDHLDRHSAGGVVGPRLVNEDGSPQPSCFPFPGPLQTFFQTTFFGTVVRTVPGLRNRYRPADAPDLPCRVPYVLGAAIALRREAFASVGGFDERFFMYSEEVDLCYRLAAAGWETHYTPLAEVAHVGGASTRQQPVEMEVRRYAATQQFYRVHFPRRAQRLLVALTTYRMLHNLVRDAAVLTTARDASRRAELRTQLAVWRGVLRATWRK